MLIHLQRSRAAILAVLALAAFGCAAIEAQSDFVTAVTATHPIAYYRLDNTAGKSLIGTTTWKSTGGVTWAAPGAPIGIPNNHFARFDGHDSKITTTQIGGVTTAASIMAWVNLASLPSKENHLVYVAGESEVGNDLDVQFDTDDALKFWTAAGGHITYAPPAGTLLNQWHMIVATLDTSTHSRVIYWDGKAVATDKGGGEAGKKNVFTIGESSVFTGRFCLHGSLAHQLFHALHPAAIGGHAHPFRLQDHRVLALFSRCSITLPGPGAASPRSSARKHLFRRAVQVDADAHAAGSFTCTSSSG
jgi:hypothetical protein